MKKYALSMVAVAAALILVQSAVAADAKADKKKAKGASGVVKSVDASAGSITLTMKVKKETQEKTFKVAPDAKIRINGEAKTLADVDEGAKAQLRLGEDGSVVAVNIGKKAKKTE